MSPSRLARTWSASSGSPMTPVEARKTSPPLQPTRPWRPTSPSSWSTRALLAGEGIGIAGIDDQRARRAGREVCAAEVDRRRRAFRAREDAATACRLIERHQQHVGAVLVLDAGLGGGDAHALDRRQRRQRIFGARATAWVSWRRSGPCVQWRGGGRGRLSMTRPPKPPADSCGPCWPRRRPSSGRGRRCRPWPRRGSPSPSRNTSHETPASGPDRAPARRAAAAARACPRP